MMKLTRAIDRNKREISRRSSGNNEFDYTFLHRKYVVSGHALDNVDSIVKHNYSLCELTTYVYFAVFSSTHVPVHVRKANFGVSP